VTDVNFPGSGRLRKTDRARPVASRRRRAGRAPGRCHRDGKSKLSNLALKRWPGSTSSHQEHPLRLGMHRDHLVHTVAINSLLLLEITRTFCARVVKPVPLAGLAVSGLSSEGGAPPVIERFTRKART
jgi:hypothetical protein